MVEANVTDCCQYRLTSTLGNVSSETLMSSNISIVGSGRTVVTNSSGTFTFTRTGNWLCTWVGYSTYNNSAEYVGINIKTTVNNSTYVDRTQQVWNRHHFTGSEGQNGATSSYLFPVFDTTLCKIRFYFFASANTNFNGSSTQNRNYFTFLRTGDTNGHVQ